MMVRVDWSAVLEALMKRCSGEAREGQSASLGLLGAHLQGATGPGIARMGAQSECMEESNHHPALWRKGGITTRRLTWAEAGFIVLCSAEKMKILVVGGGGREHALAWKLGQSAQVRKIWCVPGNGGISAEAECCEGSVADVKGLADLASRLGADLTVVGPEQPLVLGIADEFSRRGLALLGPSSDAAQLEGSKVFAKKFLERHQIPTAAPYGIFDSAVDAYTALCAVDWPVVVKADGLCGGKGVLVTSSPDEATAFLERVMEKREFGDAGSRVILEEALPGKELSYIVLTDGKRFVPLAASRDCKRAFDGDAGPNTGGMGAISSATLVSRKLEETILAEIVEPTIAGLTRDAKPYSGFLYFGLMLTEDGPKVLEFNCRLGDPETEALVMRMDFDFAETLARAARGELTTQSLGWKPGASVSVVLAAEGYPGRPRTGQAIKGLGRRTEDKGVCIFHSGTRQEGNIYYVSSGRALVVSATGENVQAARERVYETIQSISFEGMHFRTDIGAEAGEAAHA